MSDVQIMDCFSSVKHGDNNEELSIASGSRTTQEMLDYMVLVVVRELSIQPTFKGGWMLNQLLQNESGRTSDIDFSINNKSEYENVKNVLQSIGTLYKII